MCNEIVTNAVPTALSLVESLNVNDMDRCLGKITAFQSVIQKKLTSGHDYGVVPGTSKPTLLKPGAEKILMLMGLSTEYSIVDSTRDFEQGFFQYQIRCRIYRDGVAITEGFGACNTRERKYARQNPYDIDNTVLKMAKKRAMVDATLLVASLSDIFTQDLEDDIEGNSIRAQQEEKVYTDQDGTINEKQLKRMFALSKPSKEGKPQNDLVKEVLNKYGYSGSKDVKKMDYDKICKEIERRAPGYAFEAFDALPDKLPEETQEKVEEEKPIEPQEVQQQIGHHDPEFAGFDLDDIEF